MKLTIKFIVIFILLSSFTGCMAKDQNFYNRGRRFLDNDKMDSAIWWFTYCIKENPLNADCYNARGISETKIKEFDKALDDFTQAIKIDPNKVESYYNRALVWEKMGKPDRAIKDYTIVINKKSPHVKIGEVYFRRSHLAYTCENNVEKAISDLFRSIEINPSNYFSYNNLAWILSTYPEEKYRNGAKAVDLAIKALNLNKSAMTYGGLAAAYAETGDFKKAIFYQTKAIDWLTKRGETHSYNETLEFYKTNKPWRETPVCNNGLEK